MKNKLLKFFRNFVVFLTIAGILLSNIPFNALSFLIDSYEKTSGIVDKIWLIQQENNPDIVDKFVTLRDAAKKIKVKEAQAAIIAQYTGGLLVYADTVTVGTPKYQTFDDTTGFGAEQSAQSVGASAINWIRVAASPVNDEWIIVTRDAVNVIKAQVCAGIDGGVSCGTPTTITATAGTHGFRNYDVAYEQTSGDALIVYGTATADELRKIEWTGGLWINDAAITTTRTTGQIEWVELTSRPASNQIGIAYSDVNDDISAYRWNGTTAADEATAAITATAGAGNVRKFDVSFEGTSGDMLVAAPLAGAGTTATGQLVGTTWTIGTQTAPDNITDFIDLQETNTGANVIAMIAHGVTAAGANTMEGYEWSGSAMVDGTVAVDTSALNWLANYHMAATAYVNTTYYAAAIFSDTTGADDINWWTMDSAGTWTAQADNLRTRGNIGFIDLFDYPSLDKVLLISSDSNSNLWVDTWDGTTPSATVWVDRTSGGARETSLSIATKDVVDFAFRLAPPPAVNTLTIGVTSGSKVSTINSGDSSVYANDVSCTGPASCAAFTLNVSNTSVTVSSIKITEASTTNATADLSQLALFYDTDGNYSNGVTGQYGATVASFTSEAATVSGSLALTPATTYYFYVRFNASSTTPSYPKGGQTINFQIAANADVTLSSGSATITGAPVAMAGTTTVKPRMTGITYGSGLSDGARSSETITISGYGFGAALDGSQANCSGTVDTGCVRFTIGGNDTVADVDVSSWSNTSIGWTVSSTLATLGGTSALELVAGSATSTVKLTYYIYPNITAISNTAAREYDSGDTDGLVMLSGDHFGATQGMASSTGAFGNGSLAIHLTAEGSCTVGGWSAASYSGNTVCIEITSSSISDSVYSGSITLNRNSDSKTDVESNFGIMPRITSNIPANGVAGDVIQIKGNHFCQSGTCPVSPNRSSVSDNVKFGSTQALDSDFVNQTGGAGTCNGAGAAWTNTEICVKVPSGVPTGSQPTKVRTNNIYDSNTKAFTVNSTVPNDPIDLNQFKTDGLTTISAGGYSTSSTVILKATSTASMSINMALEVEVKSTGVSFDEIGIIQGPICTSCTSTSTAVNVIGLSDGNKHWRARTKNTTTNSTSSWVCFGDCNINNADFIVDANAPAISGVLSSNVGTNSATITWNTDEGATSQVQYNTTGSFVSDCATYNDCTTLDPSYVTSHIVNLNNLNSGTRYYYRVRSKDIAGNEAFSSGSTYFDTIPVGTVPAKTVVYYAYATTSVISAGATASSSFSIFMPETSASTTSAFLELTGLSLTSGTNYVQVQVNSQAAKTYNIPSNKNLFKIIYKIDGANVNIEPTASSTIYINPSIDTYVVSSRFVITYKYTP